MSKIKVAFLYGGKSTEHEVSLRSAKSVYEAMDQTRFELSLIYIDRNGRWIYHKTGEVQEVTQNDGFLLRVVPSSGFYVNDERLDIDVVFPVMHGNAGEDGNLQGLLEMVEVPYVGCNTRASSVCMDKDMTKRLLKERGILVADGVVYKAHAKDGITFEAVSEQLGLPMFVKPVNQGSSVGVSKVVDESSFEAAVRIAFEYDSKIMIERGVEGREIEVSVLGNSDLVVSVPGEIVSNTEFYSYESKYIDDDGAMLQIPAELSEAQLEKIQAVAEATYRALDCEGMSRVDVFLTKDDEVIVNEVNTIPGFTSISMYPKLLDASGVGYTELVGRLVELALERDEVQRQLKRSFN